MANDLYIFDACVLIDYLNVDETFLKLIGENDKPISIVLSVMNDEVEGLTKTKAAKLSMRILEPTLDQMVEAADASEGIGPSYHDMLSLILARDLKGTCVTAEKALYNKCKAERVSVCRGFEPLLNLIEKKALDKKTATRFVKMVIESNPRLTMSIYRDFKSKASKIK